MPKFYAVKVGKTPGIYTTWEDCKAQVDGVSGATYKSFTNVNDAAAFLGLVPNPTKTQIAPTSDGPVAYVDGSYDDANKLFSYGMVIINGDEELTFYEKFDDESLVSMRNVAGEIMGATAAMKYATQHNFSSITIYHDYEGIAKWCLGEWKANKEGTIAYKQYYDSIINQIDIKFVKVKGHSNDKYNDLADELAKTALGIN